ncbi:arginase family protein [Shinella yambaruensis]|uniref:Agmatinase n=1 Tax=Shinella yambaruensis TaxID=415996 RepID=A0ABQ5ZKM9_9HYPH|nr:arginase family protein [Shinella yambaruensis]MCJ8027179.1 arginase family protein [Shinella yambaruensis]MCU7981235.1 arginase family protein [Shinella yambaruensis]GLR52611.1 agmatinase [Shinella yambaruensis]
MNEKPDLGALFGAAAETTTFLGLAACPDLDVLSAPVALIGAPCATPYASVGAYCRNAPDALRRATGSLTANVDRHDFDHGGPVFPVPDLRPVDCGNLPFGEADTAGNRARIAEAVSKVLARGAVPVLLGGDDSIPIPMIEAIGTAAGGRKFTILQIDAHIDWREVHMGERLGLSSTMRRASEMPHVERIVQVGARGIGSAATGDYEDALAWGVSFVTAYDLHRNGVDAVLDLIPEGSDIIICIDADALDPALVPGVIGRAPGGLSYYQAVDLIKGAAKRGRIAAMDFVEFMPERDVDGIGALTFARLITTALGVLVRQAA